MGDNVGDCAGMAADVFETYARQLDWRDSELDSSPRPRARPPPLSCLPFLLGGISIVTSVFGILLVNTVKGNPNNLLMGSVAVSSALSAIAYWPAIR